MTNLSIIITDRDDKEISKWVWPGVNSDTAFKVTVEQVKLRDKRYFLVSTEYGMPVLLESE